MDIRDDRITLHFEHAGTGLRLTGLADRAFAVAGEDRKFVYARNVSIDGDTAVCKAPLERPVAVRFLWADNPGAALYNGDGLPDSLFPTDDWPLGGDGGARKN